MKNDACVVIEADLVKEIAVKDECLFHLCLHYFQSEILQFHFYTTPFSMRYFTISFPFSIRYFACFFFVEKKIVHALIFKALVDISHKSHCDLYSRNLSWFSRTFCMLWVFADSQKVWITLSKTFSNEECESSVKFLEIQSELYLCLAFWPQKSRNMFLAFC